MSACSYCGEQFTRRHPTQRFCSPVQGRRFCKDAFHSGRDSVVIVNGVAAPDGYVGLSDDEEDEVMMSATAGWDHG